MMPFFCVSMTLGIFDMNMCVWQFVFSRHLMSPEEKMKKIQFISLAVYCNRLHQLHSVEKQFYFFSVTQAYAKFHGWWRKPYAFSHPVRVHCFGVSVKHPSIAFFSFVWPIKICRNIASDECQTSSDDLMMTSTKKKHPLEKKFPFIFVMLIAHVP